MATNLQDQLHDIVGIGEVSSWPPAPIWWIVTGVVTGVVFACLIALTYYLYKARKFRLSWRADAKLELDRLEEQMRSEENVNLHQLAINLDKIIKRMAMMKFGRDEVAKLTGDDWLAWLEQHDGYSWQKKASFLSGIAYRPISKTVNKAQIKEVIKHLRGWQ